MLGAPGPDWAWPYSSRSDGIWPPAVVACLVTRYIPESGKRATIRTREGNVAMQRVIASLGFSEASVP